MFQPVGGMDMIGKAFAREVGGLIRYNAKVTEIQQNDSGVTVSYVDTANPQAVQQATADWCVCTIPLSILSQIPIDVGAAMKNAIDAVPYAGSVKVGLQFKRRFWEEDEAIYGGISYHRSADPPDRLSQHRLQSHRARRAAGRLSVRRRERLRIHGDAAGRAGARAQSSSAP